MSRPAVRALAPYVAGTSIEEVRRRFGHTRIVKLASNENPLGSSPLALAALRSADRLNLYLDDAHEALRERLGQREGLQAENVVLGHGSNEIVNTIAQTFLDPGDEVVMADPTFSLYRLVVSLVGALPVEVPLLDGVHDIERMLAAVGARTKAFFVCDPNNPTGTVLPAFAWDYLLERLPADVLLVIDRAYAEYLDTPGFEVAKVVRGRGNVIVLRTMSKAYGLASLRFGYAYGDRESIDWLQRVRLPFNVSRPAALGAAAALEDRVFLEKSIALNAAERSRVTGELRERGFHCYPSGANFYAVTVPIAAHEAYEALLERGIIVRSGDALRMPGRLRVTVGTHEENDAFLAALAEVAIGEGA
uniref:Histidinol-phosphate aminotransferase tyrosine/phenylalanine aminotransferase n=1 Tax=mine drainage metagenome TaxID=410659 RepID=E6PFB9_9ZZZZ